MSMEAGWGWGGGNVGEAPTRFQRVHLREESDLLPDPFRQQWNPHPPGVTAQSPAWLGGLE